VRVTPFGVRSNSGTPSSSSSCRIARLSGGLEHPSAPFDFIAHPHADNVDVSDALFSARERPGLARDIYRVFAAAKDAAAGWRFRFARLGRRPSRVVEQS
jgi:hypothetical protein